MLAILPTFGYKPSSGFTIGATSNLAKYLGDPATTRISSAVIGLSYSTKQQTSLTVRFGASGRENRWRLDGDNRFQWTSQDSHGLGTGTAPADGVNTKFTYVRVYNIAWRELAENVFAGAGFHFSSHTNVRPGVEGDPAWEDSAYVTYSTANGFDPGGQASTGLSLDLMLDSRDSQINASGGWLASVGYRPFVRNFLGGDSEWQEVLVDLRTYVGVTRDKRHRVAMWVYGDFVGSGVAPYFDLPALGMDTYGRSGRGYPEGRFRGERLMYGELEYRGTLTRNGLLGMVAFVNTTTLANAQTALSQIDVAITSVNTALGVIGSLQSRIEVATENVRTTMQNFSAAESTIRDLDMAAEMTTFSKNQVLSQAGTAMLAQANAAGQSILTLLRG
jgi:flagellin-like hook-associated protein FlgL